MSYDPNKDIEIVPEENGNVRLICKLKGVVVWSGDFNHQHAYDFVMKFNQAREQAGGGNDEEFQ